MVTWDEAGEYLNKLTEWGTRPHLLFTTHGFWVCKVNDQLCSCFIHCEDKSPTEAIKKAFDWYIKDNGE